MNDNTTGEFTDEKIFLSLVSVIIIPVLRICTPIIRLGYRLCGKDMDVERVVKA